MTGTEFLENINSIDDDLIFGAEYGEYRPRARVIKRLALAACLCLAVGSALLIPNLRKDPLDGYEKVTISVSWAHSYGSVQELTEASDLIAWVKITGERDGGDLMQSISSTVFTAKVKELIYGDGEETVDIIMTGRVDRKEKIICEVADDPLMHKNDEYLIFARKNESGTYTILGGPQGRYVVDNDRVYSLCDKLCAANSEAEIAGDNPDDFIETVKACIA